MGEGGGGCLGAAAPVCFYRQSNDKNVYLVSHSIDILTISPFLSSHTGAVPPLKTTLRFVVVQINSFIFNACRCFPFFFFTRPDQERLPVLQLKRKTKVRGSCISASAVRSHWTVKYSDLTSWQEPCVSNPHKVHARSKKPSVCSRYLPPRNLRETSLSSE